MSKAELQEMKNNLKKVFGGKYVTESGLSLLNDMGFQVKRSKRNTHWKLMYNGRTYTASSTKSKPSACANLIGLITRDIKLYDGVTDV